MAIFIGISTRGIHIKHVSDMTDSNVSVYSELSLFFCRGNTDDLGIAQQILRLQVRNRESYTILYSPLIKVSH